MSQAPKIDVSGHSGVWYPRFHGAAGKLLPECLGRRVGNSTVVYAVPPLG